MYVCREQERVSVLVNQREYEAASLSRWEDRKRMARVRNEAAIYSR